ncbi:hypothetical protein ABIF97_002694 [Bradyrhizobium japonicum]
MVFRIGPEKISQSAGRSPLAALFCAGLGGDLGFGDGAADVEHQQRRQRADHEHPAPRRLRRQSREQDRLRQHGETPADRPARLHRADCASAILRPDRLAHQHGARRPLAAEAETEHGARDQELVEILHDRADQREEREPDDGDLERPDTSDMIGEIAAEPAADRGGQQRHGAGESGRGRIDLPQRDDGADHQRIDHEVHAVERPARGAGPERPPLRRVHVAVEGEKAGVFDLRALNALGRIGCAHVRFPGGLLKLRGGSTHGSSRKQARAAVPCNGETTVPRLPRRGYADRARRVDRSASPESNWPRSVPSARR